MKYPVTISSLARRLDIPPRKISDLFYQRKLDDQRCPIVDGRRLIPDDYVSEIERVLREHGVLAESEAKTCHG